MLAKVNRLSRRSRSCSLLAGLLVACVAAGPVGAQSPEADFQRGYFLQTHDRDFAAAAEAFARVVENDSVVDAVRAEALQRLAECREEAVAGDLAQLMPPEAFAFVEINRPGDHVERIARMLGLVRDRSALAAEPSGRGLPLGGGLMLPADFTLSPALVAEIKKFRGAAAAVTQLSSNGEPEAGVVVVHAGESDLVRGVIETGVQVLRPEEPIGGYRAYNVDNEAVLVVTARLLIAGRTRADVEGAVARLNNPDTESLADRADLQRLADQRADSVAFVYVSGPAIAEQVGRELHGQEAQIAQTLLDLEHLESFVASVGTTDETLFARAQVNLLPGHHNLAYSLIRTAPLTRESLACVPEGVAAVAVVGLNPPSDRPLATTTGEAPPISGMDLGREFFGNIEELAVFVAAPTEASTAGAEKLPEIGVVLAVHDVAKSEALWNQLLGLAALAGGPQPATVETTSLSDHEARRYRFPGAPDIFVARVRDEALLIGTQGAVSGALAASHGGSSLADDPAFATLLDGLAPTTSKAALVDVGRATAIAAAMDGGNDRELQMIARLLADMRASAVTDEAPNHFGVHAEVTGLPHLPTVIQMLGGLADSGRPQTAEAR